MQDPDRLGDIIINVNTANHDEELMTIPTVLNAPYSGLFLPQKRHISCSYMRLSKFISWLTTLVNQVKQRWLTKSNNGCRQPNIPSSLKVHFMVDNAG